MQRRQRLTQRGISPQRHGDINARGHPICPGRNTRRVPTRQALWPDATPIACPPLPSGQLYKRQSSRRSVGSERVPWPFDNPVLYKTKTLPTNRDSNFRHLLTIHEDLTVQLLAPYKCPIRLYEEITWMPNAQSIDRTYRPCLQAKASYIYCTKAHKIQSKTTTKVTNSQPPDQSSQLVSHRKWACQPVKSANHSDQSN